MSSIKNFTNGNSIDITHSLTQPIPTKKPEITQFLDIKNEQGHTILKGLAESYLLEALDPNHRNAGYLVKMRAKWQQARQSHNTTLKLYKWIDEQEQLTGKKPIGIIYFDKKQRAEYQTEFRLINGSNYIYLNNTRCDTSNYHCKGKQGYAAYVIDKKNNLYIFEHKRHQVQHSSIKKGKHVLCAGTIKIVDGKIANITNHSGHYKPDTYNLYQAVNWLNRKKAFAEKATVCYSRFSDNFICKLNKNKHTIMQTVARFLDWFRFCRLGLLNKKSNLFLEENKKFAEPAIAQYLDAKTNPTNSFKR